MKFKPNERSGGVAIELRPEESQIPMQLADEKPAALPIFSLKKILVPVDFSDCANKALTYAAALAQQFGAELTLINVAQNYAVPEMVPLAVDLDAVDYAKRELQILRLNVGSAAACHTLLRRGVPYVEIVAAAKELGSDLIVISTRGHTGLAHVILGSTAEKVVRQAPCPVLVVREKEHEFIKPPVIHEK
jgi:nucleotide-binding universal stress UspA family protein